MANKRGDLYLVFTAKIDLVLVIMLRFSQSYSGLRFFNKEHICISLHFRDERIQRHIRNLTLITIIQHNSLHCEASFGKDLLELLLNIFCNYFYAKFQPCISLRSFRNIFEHIVFEERKDTIYASFYFHYTSNLVFMSRIN